MFVGHSDLGALGLIYVLVVARSDVGGSTGVLTCCDGAQWTGSCCRRNHVDGLWLAFSQLPPPSGLPFSGSGPWQSETIISWSSRGGRTHIPQITWSAGNTWHFCVPTLPAAGVFLAHLTPVLAYVLVVLQGPYRAFDRRLRSVSLGLNCSAWRFWSAIKAPLMMPALAAAAAVGFAVSMAQFLPAQLIGSGRITTLPVSRDAGERGNQALQAIALALVPPALGFLLAQRLGHPRWADVSLILDHV
jgi:hypothetical protein